MVPLQAVLVVAAHPELAVDLAIVRRVQVHLVAEVALLVRLEDREAVLAETDDLLGQRNGHLIELGSLLVGDGGGLLVAEGRQALGHSLGLLGVERAAVLVVAALGGDDVSTTGLLGVGGRFICRPAFFGGVSLTYKRTISEVSNRLYMTS